MFFGKLNLCPSELSVESSMDQPANEASMSSEVVVFNVFVAGEKECSKRFARHERPLKSRPNMPKWPNFVGSIKLNDTWTLQQVFPGDNRCPETTC